MPTDQRKKDVNWTVAEPDGTVPSWERAGIAVLMDIRDELQKLNALLYCGNFTGIPRTLKAIEKNTARRRAARKAGAK